MSFLRILNNSLNLLTILEQFYKDLDEIGLILQ